MQARNLSLLIVGVAVIALVVFRFLPKKDKSFVSLELVCIDGAIPSPRIDPEVAEITDRTKKFTWTLTPNSNVIEAKIIPKPLKPWPFEDLSFTAYPNQPVKSKSLKTGIPGDTYKYSIEALCPLAGGGQKTVTIDPDMIIPT